MAVGPPLSIVRESGRTMMRVSVRTGMRVSAKLELGLMVVLS